MDTLSNAPIPPALTAYAGRWVALIKGQVAGTGATRTEALASAQISQSKAQPQVIFVPEDFPYELPEIIERVRAYIPQPENAWLVGGAVRDAMLSRVGRDLDFAVKGDGLAVARRVAEALQAAFYPLDAERGMGRIILREMADEPPFTLDFAELRGADIYADLAARDFTLNAMAVPLAAPETLLDPLRGAADLRAKLIRACAPDSITADPVRGLRAVRLAAQFNFKIEKETRAAIKASAAEIANVSAERVRDELARCVSGPQPAATLRALDWLGLLDMILPELAALKGVTQSPPHTMDVWEHTLTVVARLADVIYILGPQHDMDAASDLTLGLVSVRLGRYRHKITRHLTEALSSERPTRWILLLAALLHDAAKPQTRTVDEDGRIRFLGHEAAGAKLAAEVFMRLKFSADEVKRAHTIVAHHMRPRQLSREGEPSARAIYRFFKDTGPAGVEIILLSLADLMGKSGSYPPPQTEWAEHVAACAKMLEAYFEKRETAIAPKPFITGDDLMRELNLPPGPQIGQLLEAIREAQVEGRVTDAKDALALARKVQLGK